MWWAPQALGSIRPQYHRVTIGGVGIGDGGITGMYAVAEEAAGPARDAIIARTMGLPPELRFAGVLPWQGLAEVTEELRLPRDGLLLDIACGGGGYGIEVARRADTRLVGVDFSTVALEQATL